MDNEMSSLSDIAQRNYHFHFPKSNLFRSFDKAWQRSLCSGLCGPPNEINRVVLRLRQHLCATNQAQKERVASSETLR